MKLTLPQAKTLQQIANIVSADIVGEVAHSDITIFNVATIESAGPGSITFLANPKYKKFLSTTQASAVILEQEYVADSPIPTIVTSNARLSLAKLLQLCENKPDQEAFVHPTASIGENVQIGNNVVIGAGVSVGDNCVIGDNCELKPNVTLYANVTMGNNCTIHSGSVIGSDGFGYALDESYNWVKMPHLGGVKLGDCVEIGSNTSIDRGVLDDTVIGSQVIIDNLVQIGHNVHIGNRTAIAGCAGVAGSTSIGSGCLIGGAANIGGHIEIVDNVHITGTTSVNQSITKPGIFSSGIPARENGVWRRNVARFMSLDKMAKRIKNLENKLVTAEQE